MGSALSGRKAPQLGKQAGCNRGTSREGEKTKAYHDL